jgi:hypothetical protein
MDAYELHEGRFLQEGVFTSAADALYVTSGLVPAGKVWTILSATYNPSATETRTVQYVLAGRNNAQYAIRDPVAIALTTTMGFPCVTEGMELKLFPGEYLRVQRDVATAGSTMAMKMRWVETDLPYYSYDDPLNKVVKAAQRHGSAYRSSGAVSIGGPGAAGRVGGRTGGRDGGGEPI